MDLSNTERPALSMKLWQCSRRLTFMYDTGLCHLHVTICDRPIMHDMDGVTITVLDWNIWCPWLKMIEPGRHLTLSWCGYLSMCFSDAISMYVKLTRSKWLCRIPRVSKYNSRLAWSCIEIQAWWSTLPRWYTEKTQVYSICMGRLVGLIFDVYPVEMNWTLWRDATSMMDVERVYDKKPL